MQPKLIAAALIAFSVGYTGQISFSPLPSGSSTFKVVDKANAQTTPQNSARRISRRTGRRTSRRVEARHSVDGCVPYNAYYNCGGVYYQAVVENGVTVYVVVNP